MLPDKLQMESIDYPKCGACLTVPRVDEKLTYIVRCEGCAGSFKLTFGFSNEVQIEPILDTADRPESLAETFPECKFDFPAAMRERIIEDVTLHGETFRCFRDLSSAFAGWQHAQIDEWCLEHSVVIIAHPNGRIVIKPMATRPLAEIRAELAAENATRIRAEVEAMDWPEVIDC